MILVLSCSVFFFNDTATTEIYTLSLHDALPILCNYPDYMPVVFSRKWRTFFKTGNFISPEVTGDLVGMIFSDKTFKKNMKTKIETEGDDQDYPHKYLDRKSTRLNSSHTDISRMPSSA